MDRHRDLRRRLRDAIAAYEVTDAALTTWMAAITAQEPGRSRTSFVSGLRTAIILQVAAVHYEECASLDCRTCLEILEGLAVLAANERLSDREEFERMVEPLT